MRGSPCLRLREMRSAQPRRLAFPSLGCRGNWASRRDSSSAMLCVLGDRGVLGIYTPPLRLPGLNGAPEPAEQADMCMQTGIAWTLITSLVIGIVRFAHPLEH